ncbi:GDSL-type esterase/lipase family protein [Streptomyces sp. NPDC006458]|uniref:GDSL-type esterase/lipase family protein n=1 Tax=Streptomyces sp. NPDC006458 TaxID=3154302 RepID=UPI0033A91B5A
MVRRLSVVLCAVLALLSGTLPGTWTAAADAAGAAPVVPAPRPPGGGTPSMADSRQALAGAPRPTMRILVMGDSYSAGNGAGGYYGAAGCYRSHANYAEVFASTIGASPYDQPASVTNVACSGAVTADFRNSRAGRPPELSAVDHTYDLILLTIGGNDAYFSDIVKHCLVARTRTAKHCGPNLSRAEGMLKNGTLQRRITTVLKDIRAKANSGASIVLLGYPLLEGDSTYTLKSGDAPPVKVGKRLRTMGVQADALQAAVVKSLNPATGGGNFRFVSTQALFNGPPYHGLYAQKTNTKRWMVQPVIDASLATYMTWYHPNPTGWANEGRLLARTKGVPTSKTYPVITSRHLPDAVAGRAYTARLTTADNRPGTWSLTSGSLPAGLTLRGATISGVPRNSGYTELGVRFVDASGTSSKAGTDLLVNSPSVAGTWSSTRAPLPTGRGGPSGAVPTVSCGGPVCAGHALYPDTGGHHRYALLHLRNGVWETRDAPYPAGVERETGPFNTASVECDGQGDCVGGVTVHAASGEATAQVFWTLLNGVWTARKAPLPADADRLLSGPDSLSCGVDVCGGLGWYLGREDSAWHEVLWTWTRETGWQAAGAPLPPDIDGNADSGDQVFACGEGVCAVTAHYRDTAGVAHELLWTWRPLSGWSVRKAQLPAGATLEPNYAAVSCGSSVCAAVGLYRLSEQDWRSVVWTWQPSTGWDAGRTPPSPADATYPGQAYRMSCGGDVCVAPGSYYGPQSVFRNLVWVWTAHSGWSVQQPEPLGGAADRAGATYQQASCGATLCALTGSYKAAGGHVVTVLWTTTDGVTWTADENPGDLARNPQPPYVNHFELVGCGPTQCAAFVSYWDSTAKTTRNALLHTAGSAGAWSVDTPTPLPADAGEDPGQYLYETSCGTTTCVVTGSYYTDLSLQEYQGVIWTRTTE